MNVLEQIASGYSNEVMNTTMILAVLAVVGLLCAYEFVVYRLVSHRAFYNKSFNICLVVLPFFISTIILCLQSNIVITLGTIGALAIIRFRTAIKDPVDMLYLLWSIHIGITCGCQLYEVAVLTSVVVTIVLLILENVSFGRKPYVIVLHLVEDVDEKKITDIVALNCKSYRIKSRNYTQSGVNLVIEASVKNMEELTANVRDMGVEKFSVIEYDSDDIF